MPLSDAAKQTIVETLARSPHGTRVATVRRLADTYGVSPTTIYRHAARQGTPRRHAQLRPEYRDWVRIATRVAHRAPGEPVPLDIAIKAALASGELPPEAAAMPLGTAHRVRRELGLHLTAPRTQRLHADYPMQAVQFDGSTSMYLSVVRRDGDADWLLRLYRRPIPARGYKNKPLGPDRERPVTYGLWDMCTGCRLSRYVVAQGENALDAVDSLVWMLTEKDDKRLVMHGVPDDLWLDQGPVTKSAITTDLLDRLGINLVTGEAYNKTRMAGVERAWRTLWARFERALFLRDSDEILLSEVNDRLTEYLVQENGQRGARVLVGGRRASRTDAWTALTNARPPDNRLRRLPDRALATLAATRECTLDSNGRLRWGGVEYEAPTLYGCRVTARRAPDGSGHVVITCRQTGVTETAHPAQARPYGDVRANAPLPLEQLRKAAPAEWPGADVYAPRDGALPAGVAALPVRSEPAQALPDPLAGGCHAGIEEAMRAFFQLYPHPVSDEQYRAVADILLQAGLSRQAVTDLAQEMAGLAAQTKQEILHESQ